MENLRDCSLLLLPLRMQSKSFCDFKRTTQIYVSFMKLCIQNGFILLFTLFFFLCSQAAFTFFDYALWIKQYIQRIYARCNSFHYNTSMVYILSVVDMLPNANELLLYCTLACFSLSPNFSRVLALGKNFKFIRYNPNCVIFSNPGACKQEPISFEFLTLQKSLAFQTRRNEY